MVLAKISNFVYRSKPSYASYAWFNSTCYHAPRVYPRGFAIFFSLGGLFPTPGHAERDNSPPPGLLIDHKDVVLCTNIDYDIDFRTVARPDILTRT